MNIDWSKAPDGTQAAQPETSQLLACWYRLNSWGEVEVIIDGSGIDWVHMGGRKDFPHGHVLRPESA